MEFMIGFYAVFAVFSLVFFVFIMPRMLKMREQQKRQREEEKVRKQQNITLIEKEKLERELMKQKLLRDADLETQNLQPKFCQYCGTKFSEGSSNCPSCGAAVKQ